MNTSFPAIALGTWSWGSGAVGGDRVFGNHLTEDDLKPVVERAMDKGLNLWDTAPVYGQGTSETILGNLLAPYDRQSYFLSTKFTPGLAGSEDNAMELMLDASLKRLHADYVDVYWIHNPQDVEKWTPQLIGLVKSGKVRSVGVSNHNLAQIKRATEILAAGGVELSAIQNHFSLLYRSSEDAGIVDYCTQNGLDFYAYMVLEQGALTGKYGPDNPLPAGSDRAATYNKSLPKLAKLNAGLTKIGEAHGGASIAEVATAWALAKQTKPLIGVTKPAHVDSQARVAALQLSGEEVAQMEQLAAETGVDTKGGWERPMV